MYKMLREINKNCNVKKIYNPVKKSIPACKKNRKIPKILKSLPSKNKIKY